MTLLQGAIGAGMMLMEMFIVVLAVAVVVALLYISNKNRGGRPSPGRPQEPESEDRPAQKLTTAEGCSTFFIVIAIAVIGFLMVVGLFTCNKQFDDDGTGVLPNLINR